jgi:exo-beta-1,3-glucanase (GH17 family)
VSISKSLLPFVCRAYLGCVPALTAICSTDLEPEELSYTRQKTILENALATYGTDNVLGIAVGNEYVLQAGNNGDTTANASARVVEKMNEVRTDLTALGYNLQVGTSDTGGTTTQDMVDNADL